MFRQGLYFLALLALLTAISVLGEWTLSPAFQKCIAAEQDSKGGNAPKEEPTGFGVTFGRYVGCTGAFVEDHGNGITALATVVIAAFTGTLWIATSRQALLTREALIGDKRAFIFPTNLDGFWERPQENGPYVWRFRPRWMNSGDTPSKNLTNYTGCELRNTRLPDGFDFSGGNPGGGLLPPKTELHGGLAPQWPAAAITPQDILDVQAGTKFLYVWGWARYNDVFPKTAQHITRFCWIVTPLGDPTRYIPGKKPPEDGGLAFPYVHHKEGNCADDECA
jgi:hypothetical protein